MRKTDGLAAGFLMRALYGPPTYWLNVSQAFGSPVW